MIKSESKDIYNVTQDYFR